MQVARAAAAGRSRAPLELSLPSAPVLRKHLTLPLGARANLDSLLGFEIERETPFASDEIYWAYEIAREDRALGRLDVELVVIPRSSVDPILNAARRAGLTPACVEVTRADGLPITIGLAGGSPMQQRGEQRRLVGLAAATGALALLALTLPLVRQQFQMADTRSKIETLTAPAEEAATLRRSIDRAAAASAFLAGEQTRSGNTLAALAAVTQAIPDTTYLTALSLRSGHLTLTGLSPQAAALVGSLATSRVFRDPAFASPVVQADGGLELFTISVTLPAPGTTPGPS